MEKDLPRDTLIDWSHMVIGTKSWPLTVGFHLEWLIPLIEYISVKLLNGGAWIYETRRPVKETTPHRTQSGNRFRVGQFDDAMCKLKSDEYADTCTFRRELYA
ncbi:unnamed protein product [Ilex paraguariensis]|uniref:Uncharacterized protein n=1 Tax=Ilex paraguariensis TaxID=185542 RepID=A0ABC8RE78_9AQUA